MHAQWNVSLRRKKQTLLNLNKCKYFFLMGIFLLTAFCGSEAIAAKTKENTLPYVFEYPAYDISGIEPSVNRNTIYVFGTRHVKNDPTTTPADNMPIKGQSPVLEEQEGHLVSYDVSGASYPKQASDILLGHVHPDFAYVRPDKIFLSSTAGYFPNSRPVLVVIDTATPNKPRVASTIIGSVKSIAANGDKVALWNYKGKGNEAFDLSDPYHPVEINFATAGLDKKDEIPLMYMGELGDLNLGANYYKRYDYLDGTVLAFANMGEYAGNYVFFDAPNTKELKIAERIPVGNGHIFWGHILPNHTGLVFGIMGLPSNKIVFLTSGNRNTKSCTTTKDSIYEIVCKNAQLSLLDTDLNFLYREKFSALSDEDKKIETAIQHQWLLNLSEECAGNAFSSRDELLSCIRNQYLARLDHLKLIGYVPPGTFQKPSGQITYKDPLPMRELRYPDTRQLYEKTAHIIQSLDISGEEKLETLFSETFPELKPVTIDRNEQHLAQQVDRTSLTAANNNSSYVVTRDPIRLKLGGVYATSSILSALHIHQLDPKKICLRGADFQQFFDDGPAFDTGWMRGNSYTLEKTAGRGTLTLTIEEAQNSCLQDLTISFRFFNPDVQNHPASALSSLQDREQKYPGTTMLRDKIRQIIKNGNIRDIAYLENTLGVSFSAPVYDDKLYAAGDHADISNITRKTSASNAFASSATDHTYNFTSALVARINRDATSTSYSSSSNASLRIQINPEKICPSATDFMSLFEASPWKYSAANGISQRFYARKNSKGIYLTLYKTAYGACISDILIQDRDVPESLEMPSGNGVRHAETQEQKELREVAYPLTTSTEDKISWLITSSNGWNVSSIEKLFGVQLSNPNNPSMSEAAHALNSNDNVAVWGGSEVTFDPATQHPFAGLPPLYYLDFRSELNSNVKKVTLDISFNNNYICPKASDFNSLFPSPAQEQMVMDAPWEQVFKKIQGNTTYGLILSGNWWECVRSASIEQHNTP